MDPLPGPLRVLVVEDHDDGRDSYAALLTLLGHSPTVARSWLPVDAMRKVATFDPVRGRVHVDAADGAAEALTEWLGLPPDADLDSELDARGARYQLIADLEKAYHSGDPVQRRTAQHLADRYKITLPISDND